MPVNGATAPNTTVLQTYLDSVYRQANVRFTVTEKTGFRFNLDTNNVAGLERAGSGINKYSAEMRMLRDKFASDTTYDKKANYIFVVSAFEGGGLDGFMVRGRSMGFVASGASKRTYAHELGHGLFGLEHTFPEIGQSLSNNLMDYGDSTHLTHKQCRDIAKRKFVFNWADSEEDGSLYDISLFKIDDVLTPMYKLAGITSDNTLNYVTPKGEIIKLPYDTKVSFSGYAEYFNSKKASTISKNGIGVLTAFEINNEVWTAHFANSLVAGQENDKVFTGYFARNGASGYKNYVFTTLQGTQAVVIGKEEIDCQVAIYKGNYTSSIQADYRVFNKILFVNDYKEQVGFKQIPQVDCFGPIYDKTFTKTPDNRPCFIRAKTRAKEAFSALLNLNSITIAVQGAIFMGQVEYVICLTEKEKQPTTSSNLELFNAGFMNAVFESLDAEKMVKGLSELIWSNYKKKLECLENNPVLLQTPCQSCDQSNIHVLNQQLQCLWGFTADELLQNTDGAISALYGYIEENYGDAYEQGRVAGFLATCFVPAANAAKFTKLSIVISKLSNSPLKTKLLKLVGKLEGKTTSQMMHLLGYSKHPSVKSALKKLKDNNLIINVGDCSNTQVATITMYTENGNIVLDAMRNLNETVIDVVNFTAHEKNIYTNLIDALAELRKTSRLHQFDVYRGRTYTLSDFNYLFNSGKTQVPLKGFQSTTISRQVAIDFLPKTGQYIPVTTAKARVLMKIKSKNGVYIDDISDYGQTLGPIYRPNSLIQQEVLLEEGFFKQIGTPKLLKYENGIPWYEVELEELGTALRTINH